MSWRNWELWKPILSLAKFFDENELLRRMKRLALDKVAEAQSFHFDNHEVILVETLLALFDEDNYYSLRIIRNGMARGFHNDTWLTCRKVSALLRRLGFSQTRRIRLGTQFFFRVSEVRDIARRLGISVRSEGTTEETEDQTSESEQVEASTS